MRAVRGRQRLQRDTVCVAVKGVKRCIIDITSPVVCGKEEDTVCKQNQCDPKSGECAKVPVNNDASCEDGDPCTVGDKCAAGKCTGGSAKWCECMVDADCAAVGGGNKCIGTVYCAKSVFPYRCKVNDADAVNCSTDKDSACTKSACDPDKGGDRR